MMFRLEGYIYPIAACFILLFTLLLTEYELTKYLYLFLLFLPLLDFNWRIPKLSIYKKHNRWALAVCISCVVSLIVAAPSYFEYFVIMFVFTAFPEEWFFRTYLLTKLGGDARANIVSSLAFSLLHAITRGPAIAFEVFMPSLFFGFIYQKTGSLLFCVCAHATSNIVFTLLLKQYFVIVRAWLGYSI